MITRPHLAQGDFLLLFCSILWGASFALTHGAVSSLPIMGVVGLRFLIAAILLLLINPKSKMSLSKRELTAGIAIGFTMFAGYGAQAESLAYLEPGQTAFIEALYVPLVPIAQFALFPRQVKKPGYRMIICITLAFFGLLLISGIGHHSFTLSPGLVFAIIDAFAITMEIILVAKFAADIDPAKLGFVQCTTVAVLAGLIFLCNDRGISSPPLTAVAITVLLGGFSALLQPAMNFAMKTVSATRAV